ncbi:MAG: hypothetical protein FWG61_00470 [Firmicutes bacterium]|nr:hypothetical protein [Bacillota bacterium]
MVKSYVKTKKKVKGFTEEERRLRIRMLELDFTVDRLAAEIGIRRQDVTAVIIGTSRSPRYVFEVYKRLGIEQINQDLLNLN